MNKIVLIGLLGFVIGGVFGFVIIGDSARTTTYESDLAGCTNICEPNSGVKRIWTNVYCSCENGALFTEDQIRDAKE